MQLVFRPHFEKLSEYIVAKLLRDTSYQQGQVEEHDSVVNSMGVAVYQNWVT